MRQPRLDNSDPVQPVDMDTEARGAVGLENAGPRTEAVSAQRVQCGPAQRQASSAPDPEESKAWALCLQAASTVKAVTTGP